MENWQKQFGLNTAYLMSNPFEAFTNMSNNSQEIVKNNLKYHKACIAYHQALHDMLEAIDDNTKLLKNITKK